MFQIKFVEKIKTSISSSTTFFFFPENRDLYEIMWKNMVERHRPQMIKRRMRFACLVTKTTDTLRIFKHLLFFHSNNGFANAPQRYVIRPLPLFFLPLFSNVTRLSLSLKREASIYKDTLRSSKCSRYLKTLMEMSDFY